MWTWKKEKDKTDPPKVYVFCLICGKKMVQGTLLGHYRDRHKNGMGRP
jgi:hypothetical protein